MSARILFPAFLLLFHLLPTFGQTPNLSIVLDTSLSDIKVGQFFAVTGRIQLTNGNPVPSGQTIVALLSCSHRMEFGLEIPISKHGTDMIHV